MRGRMNWRRFRTGMLLCMMAAVFSFGSVQSNATEATQQGNQVTNGSRTEKDASGGSNAGDLSGSVTVSGNGEEEQPYLIEGLSAAPIVYGQPLSASRLSCTQVLVKADNSVITGQLLWNTPQEIPEPGKHFYTAVFVPDIQEGIQNRKMSVLAEVEIRPVQPQIQTPPMIQAQKPFIYGDRLKDVYQISGGQAVFTDPQTQQTKAVAGVFEWENPDFMPEAGVQTCNLNFKPNDTNYYATVQIPVAEIEVLQREISLELTLKNETLNPGERLQLTVQASEHGALKKIPGVVHLYVNDEKVDGEWSFKENGLVKAALELKEEGIYRVKAVYTPADNNILAAQSSEKTAKAGKVLRKIITDSPLAKAKVDEAYETLIQSNASSIYQIRYSLESGALPEGLALTNVTAEDGSSIARISGTPKKGGDFAFTIAATDGSNTVTKDFTLTVAEEIAPLQLSVECSDVFYGQKPAAVVKAAVSELQYTCFYEGIRDTAYEKSESIPQEPGQYRVTAVVTAPVQYQDAAASVDFSIHKAKPVLTVTADPAEITGGGDLVLTIVLKNPYDEEQTAGLPSALSLAFDKDVKTKQNENDGKGTYRQVISVENKDEVILCKAAVSANEFYEAAEAEVKIVTHKKKEEPAKPAEKPAEKPKEEPKEEEHEPEPVIKTPEEVEADFWQDIIFRIYKANEKGETVTINAKGHSQMPDKVMEALRSHTKASLALVWEGDMILIQAGKAVPAQKGRVAWTFMELTKLYPMPKPVVPTPPAQQQPAQPAKPSKPSKPAQSTDQPAKDKDSQGGIIIIDSDDEEETLETEEETQTEVQSEEESVQAEVPEQDATETEISEEETKKPVDWFMVAVWICAGAGVLAVGTAVTAMLLGNRR